MIVRKIGGVALFPPDKMVGIEMLEISQGLSCERRPNWSVKDGRLACEI